MVWETEGEDKQSRTRHGSKFNDTFWAVLLSQSLPLCTRPEIIRDNSLGVGEQLHSSSA